MSSRPSFLPSSRKSELWRLMKPGCSFLAHSMREKAHSRQATVSSKGAPSCLKTSFQTSSTRAALRADFEEK